MKIVSHFLILMCIAGILFTTVSMLAFTTSKWIILPVIGNSLTLLFLIFHYGDIVKATYNLLKNYEV